MIKTDRFTVDIQNAGGGGAFVGVPFDVEKAFGSKRPKVKAMIDGIAYRGTLMRMGTECHMLGILKSIREQSGKTFGDEVDGRRWRRIARSVVVEVPAVLQEWLVKEKALHEFFELLSFTHKREYVNYIWKRNA